MVMYAKVNRCADIPAYMIGYIAYPDSQRTAKRYVELLAGTGFITATEDGYHVPAFDDWPPLLRVGTRDPIPDRVRDEVYARDGYRCLRCPAEANLTLDHIIPWSEYGPDTPDNLQTLCRPCNSKKGTGA